MSTAGSSAYGISAASHEDLSGDQPPRHQDTKTSFGSSLLSWCLGGYRRCSERGARRWLPGSGDAAIDFLWLLLALTAARGVIYALLNPPFGSPDEQDHFAYVANLATAGASGPRGGEGHQLMSYYLLMVPAYWLTAEQSRAVQDLAIRLASLPFLLGTVLFAWHAGRRMAPANPFVPTVAAAFVALHPQLAYIGASANNDGAANLMGAVLTYLVVSHLSGGASRWTALATALAIGAALMTKGQILPIALIATLVLLVSGVPWIASGSWRRLLLGGIPAVGLAVAAASTAEGSLMMARTGAVLSFLGDWARCLQTVQETGLAPFSYLFTSFWAAFLGESVQLPGPWYLGPTAVVALAAVAYLSHGLRGRGAVLSIDRRALTLRFLLLSMILAQFLAVYLRYLYAYLTEESWKLQVLQGRFLFVSIVPLALLVAEGWSLGIGKTRQSACALAIIALLAVFDLGSLGVLTLYHSWPRIG